MKDNRTRQISPIYDAIERGDNNEALRLCEKREICTWDITKALKAAALSRQGFKIEAMGLCREIMAKHPTEEDVIAALDSALKNMEAHNDLISFYQDVARKQPSNVNIQREIYCTAIRARNYLLAQQTAMKMFKIDSPEHGPSRRFLFCAACCILIQHRRSTDVAVISLASRLLSKIMDDKASSDTSVSPNFTGEEVLLYVTLLREEGRYPEALERLHKFASSNASALPPLEHNRPSEKYGLLTCLSTEEKLGLETDILCESGNLIGARSRVCDLLDQFSDQWLYYLKYITLTEEIYMKEVGDRDEINWIRWIEAITFVNQHKKAELKLRGPELAELELIKRLVDKFGPQTLLPPDWPGADVTNQSSLVDLLCVLICTYFEAQCTKRCCFEDLRPYLSILKDNEKGLQRLLDFFDEKSASYILSYDTSNGIGDANEDVHTKETAILQKYTSANQILRFLKQSLVSDFESKLAHAQDLVQQYCRTLHLKSDDGQRTFQTGDDILVLAMLELQDLIKTYFQNELEAYLLSIESLGLLEYGIRLSPFSYHLKIIAIEMYLDIGCFSQAFTHFLDLNTKQIQVESMSYLMLPGCLSSGLFFEAMEQCRNVLNIHRICSRDTGDYIGQACMYGNYSKALEMSAFQEKRMDCSLQLAFCKAELFSLELLKRNSFNQAKSYLSAFQMGILPECMDMDKTEPKVLSDNFDRSVLPKSDYCATTAESESERRKLNFKLKRRMLLNNIMLRVFTESAELEASIEELSSHLNLEDPAAEHTSESELNTWSTKMERLSWDLAIACSHAVLEKSKKLRDKADDFIFKATEYADCIRQGLLNCSYSHVCQAQPVASVPLAKNWIDTVSKLVYLLGTSICHLYQDLSRFHFGGIKRPKKSKNKPKKGSKPGPNGGQNALTNDPFEELNTALVKLLRVLSDLLRAETVLKEGEESALNCEWGLDKSNKQKLPVLICLEGFDKKKVPQIVMASQGHSATKLLAVVKDMQAAMNCEF